MTSVDTDIYTFTAVNGSADATKNTEQLVWSLDPSASNYNNLNAWFEFANPSVGALTVKSSYSLVSNYTYTIPVLATDVNGNGLSGGCTVTFTVVGPRVNRALCEGWQTSVVTNCGDALQVQFLNSATIEFSGGVGPVSGQYYANNTINNTYNVLAESQNVASNTTGKLKQGTLYIQGALENVNAPQGGGISVRYTIQVDLDSTPANTWQQAQDTTTNYVIFNEVISGGGNMINYGVKHTFTQPGEYRILTQDITGSLCGMSGSVNTLIFNFGDDNYSTCTGAPA